METQDTYLTVKGVAEAIYKEKGSKFLAYCYHVENEDEIKDRLSELAKEYFDATHHCYAWRLGYRGEAFRANDNGEPSGTAGRPILGQLLSANLTNTLVVVVRYFGGTKLGVSGLISAYKESAAEVIANAEIVELTINRVFDIRFGYLVMNDVMKIIKDMQPVVVYQKFDNLCSMRLSVREGLADEMEGRLKKTEGVEMVDKV